MTFQYILLFPLVFFSMTCSAAFGEPVPANLAAMTASLFDQVKDKSAAMSGSEGRGWAVSRALEAMREQDIQHWGERAVSVPDPTPAIMAVLDLDATDKPSRELVGQLLLARSEEEMVAIIQNVFARTHRDAPNKKQMAQLVQKVAEAIAGAYEGLTRRFVMTGQDDKTTISLGLAPETRSFSISVENPGSDYVEPFETVFAGEVTPVSDDSTGDLTLEVEPAKVPVIPLVLDDLRAMAQSIYGQWTTPAGQIWYIRPVGDDSNADTSESRPDQPAKAGVEARKAEDILAEIDSLKAKKVFVWSNPDTGAEERQDRFRRKPDPWRYLGDDYAAPDAKARIRELESELDALNSAEESRPPMIRDDPVDFDGAAEHGGVPIRIEVTTPGCGTATFDDALYTGRRLTARRTLGKTCEIREPPDDVVAELVRSWSPPEWVELTVTPDPGTGELDISGARWRLHVTYDGDTHEIDSIHTPYATPLTLSRTPRKGP